VRLVRPSIAVFLVLLFVAGWSLTLFLNWTASEKRLPVANMDRVAYTVRVIDDWTGSPVASGRIEPGEVVAFQGRSDEWWVQSDPSRGRYHGFTLQVLDGCILTTSGGLDDNGVGAVTAIWDGEVTSTDWESVGRRPSTIPVLSLAADPCADGQLRPRGQIFNRTLVPVSVGHGVVVPACSELTVLPGDLPHGDVPEPPVPAGAVRVVIPSMDAQDERWPTEPRAVVIGASEITDGWGTFNAVDAEPCVGAPRPGAAALE
jgi:hypothetical protein